MTHIAVVGGAGYVGLAYAVTFAQLGHDVIALDVDTDKVDLLSQGQVPIFEPGLTDLLKQGLASGRLCFTENYAEAIPESDFVFICVGTPADDAGRAQMRHVLAAAHGVSQHARGHTIIVNKSTMPVGSVDLVAEILAEHACDGATFDVVANPEFLREGSAIHDILHPDRIVLGALNQDAAERVAGLYAELGAPMVFTDPCTAEMIKYASNAFLASKISFANEVAFISERLGADAAVVTQGMGLDDRIGPRFLGAGAGFGGSCFPKDVRALAAMAREVGHDPTMLNAVLAINDAARQQLVDKLTTFLGDLAGKRIAIFGLAFKPDTDDVRDAPALDIIRALVAAGACVRATDPVALVNAAASLEDVNDVAFVEDPYVAAMGADAIVVVTEWALFHRLDFDHLANAMRGSLVVDGRNALDAAAVAAAGLTWVGVGRPTIAPTSLAGSTTPIVNRTQPAKTWAAAAAD